MFSFICLRKVIAVHCYIKWTFQCIKCMNCMHFKLHILRNLYTKKKSKEFQISAKSLKEKNIFSLAVLFYSFLVRKWSIHVCIFQCTDCNNPLETVTYSRKIQRYTFTHLHSLIFPPFGKQWFFFLCPEQKWNLHVCICLTRATSTCTVSRHSHISLSAYYHHLIDTCIALGIAIAF